MLGGWRHKRGRKDQLGVCLYFGELLHVRRGVTKWEGESENEGGGGWSSKIEWLGLCSVL